MRWSIERICEEQSQVQSRSSLVSKHLASTLRIQALRLRRSGCASFNSICRAFLQHGQCAGADLVVVLE
jgi:hypothetical protein